MWEMPPSTWTRLVAPCFASAENPLFALCHLMCLEDFDVLTAAQCRRKEFEWAVMHEKSWKIRFARPVRVPEFTDASELCP